MRCMYVCIHITKSGNSISTKFSLKVMTENAANHLFSQLIALQCNHKQDFMLTEAGILYVKCLHAFYILLLYPSKQAEIQNMTFAYILLPFKLNN